MLGWLKRTLTITLDVDWLYRKLGLARGATPRSLGRDRVEWRHERSETAVLAAL